MNTKILLLLIFSLTSYNSLSSDDLKLTRPNGGEVFVGGSDELISWEGITPEDTVKLEYSTNNGMSWKMITNFATGLQYDWKNIPDLKSQQCLIRIKFLGIGTNGDNVPPIEWQKTYGGSNADIARCMQMTNDGGYIITGSTKSIDGDVIGNSNSNSNNCWTVKLDVIGNIEWQNIYKLKYDNPGESIQQTPDGGYIITGTVYMASTNTGDTWVIGLNGKGELQWETHPSNGNKCSAYSILTTKENGFIITGSISDVNGDISGFRGAGDGWLMKGDSSGDIQWQKAFGGSSNDGAHSIVPTKDHGYIIAGRTYSNDGDVSVNKGESDFWTVKFDSAANIQWQNTYGGSSYDIAESIQQTNDGGYIVAGYTSSDDCDVSGIHGGTDFWILKLDYNGVLQWEKTLGGSNNDRAHEIIQTNDGGYIVLGYTSSNDGDISKNKGLEDSWIIKLDIHFCPTKLRIKSQTTVSH